MKGDDVITGAVLDRTLVVMKHFAQGVKRPHGAEELLAHYAAALSHAACARAMLLDGGVPVEAIDAFRADIDKANERTAETLRGWPS